MSLKIRLIFCIIAVLFFVALPDASESWIIQSVSQEIVNKDGSGGLQSSVQIAGGLNDDLFIVQQTNQISGRSNPDVKDIFAIPQDSEAAKESKYTANLQDIIQDIKRRDEASRLDFCKMDSLLIDCLPDGLDNLSENGREKLATTNFSRDITVEVSEILADPVYDFGDAPDCVFHTLLASNGARHRIVPGFYLGEEIDEEDDGAPGLNASRDDLGGVDDEDGIRFLDAIAPGGEVHLIVTSSQLGFLNAWIDFDCNGDWAGEGEMIFSDLLLNKGENHLSFLVPAEALPGQLCSRFRLSSKKGLPSDGAAPDGEVEDYCISVKF